jgi:hypothetical protein
VSEIDS